MTEHNLVGPVENVNDILKKSMKTHGGSVVPTTYDRLAQYVTPPRPMGENLAIEARKFMKAHPYCNLADITNHLDDMNEDTLKGEFSDKEIAKIAERAYGSKRALSAKPNGQDRAANRGSQEPIDPTHISTHTGPRLASELFIKPINWIWYPRIPGGMVTIIGGMGGIGKGNIVIDFAKTITTGGQWGDDAKFEKPANVLICELEDPAEQVVIPRMITAGVDRKRVYLVSKISEMPINLADFIREHDIRLVGLSPLTCFLESKDNNDERDVRYAIMSIADHLPETCALVGTIHLNKSSVDAIQRLLGSVSFVNYPRSVLMAIEDKTENRMLLTHEKTNMKKAPALEFKTIFAGMRGEEQQQFVKLEWSVPTDAAYVSADSVMAAGRKIATANPAWLLGYLTANGPTLKSDVLEAAKEEDRKPKGAVALTAVG